MNNIDYIESKGFKVRGRYISRPNSSKIIGQLNEKNFYFYNQNCYPFKSGVNFFNETTLVSADDLQYKKYIKEIIANERNDFNIDFEQYIEATKTSGNFISYLNNLTDEWLSKSSNNYFDVRVISKGYMEGASVFPFFDINNNFITAQIIKYDNNGKRNKGKFSTNWLHSYKPLRCEFNLDENDKYSVSIKSFFGEQYLNGSDNVVAIVEAPKTAVILKEIYPNIDWLATAGETQIKTKDLSVLEGKQVVLFPDAHTTLWNEFATEKGFDIWNGLDTEEVEEGSDLVDVIFKSDLSLYGELKEVLFNLNDGTNILDNSSSLEFRQIRTSNEYMPIFPSSWNKKQLRLSEDNADNKNIVLNDFHFNIYNEPFKILNSNVNFHKLIADKKAKGCLRFMNEKEFTSELERSFRLLKHFESNYYLDVFKFGLKRLKSSNFKFNEKYVLNVLVKKWESTDKDLKSYIKTRNWKFKGSENLTRTEFITSLNNSKYKAKAKIHLLAFSDVLEENRFIHLETDLGIQSNHCSYKTLLDLVNQWNENVIGAKTYKAYINQQVIENCVKNDALHINNSIYSESKNTQSNISASEIGKITGIKNNKAINHFLKFKRDNELAFDIKNQVADILFKLEHIEPIRETIKGKTRIVDFTFKKQENKKDISRFNQDWNNAFFEEVSTDAPTDIKEFVFKSDSLVNDVLPNLPKDEKRLFKFDFNFRNEVINQHYKKE